MLVKFKNKLISLLEDKIPNSLLQILPSGYSLIGDILILRISESLKEYYNVIGNAILKVEPRAKVVVRQIDTVSTFRQPIVEHIAGEMRTITTHVEFNTKFFLDVSKITFSPGNKEERNRMIQTINDGEIIYDMFACIGNLSLPIAVNHKNTKIIGVEKNPIAFKFLKSNIVLNGVEDKYTAVLGDNREVHYHNMASRVIMGFFNSDKKQLNYAIDALDGKGWLHYHVLIKRGEELEIKKDLIKIIMGFGVSIKEFDFRRVKKFSPSKIHYCIDIYIKKV